MIFRENKNQNTKFCLTCLENNLFNNQLTAHGFINLGHQLGGPGTPAKMFGIPKGSPKDLFV